MLYNASKLREPIMAKQNVATVQAPPIAAKKASGGKPIATTANLSQLQAALAAFGRARRSNSGQGGSAEYRLLDGRTYDDLAEECIVAGPGETIILVAGDAFKMDSKLKSIAARFRRGLASDNRDDFHRLGSYEVTVKEFEGTKGFRFLNEETGQMETMDIPNLIQCECNPGIADKRDMPEWEAIAEKYGVELAEEVEVEEEVEA